jgi:hypothetical protein
MHGNDWILLAIYLACVSAAAEQGRRQKTLDAVPAPSKYVSQRVSTLYNRIVR